MFLGFVDCTDPTNLQFHPQFLYPNFHETDIRCLIRDLRQHGIIKWSLFVPFEILARNLKTKPVIDLTPNTLCCPNNAGVILHRGKSFKNIQCMHTLYLSIIIPNKNAHSKLPHDVSTIKHVYIDIDASIETLSLIGMSKTCIYGEQTLYVNRIMTGVQIPSKPLVITITTTSGTTTHTVETWHKHKPEQPTIVLAPTLEEWTV